jgi:hypothetical protein
LAGLVLLAYGLIKTIINGEVSGHWSPFLCSLKRNSIKMPFRLIYATLIFEELPSHQ